MPGALKETSIRQARQEGLCFSHAIVLVLPAIYAMLARRAERRVPTE